MRDKFRKVFKIFTEQYILVPLEIYEADPYKTLISTLLSARTRDEVTLERSQELFKKAPNIKSLNRLPLKKIENIIYPIGFYKTKAKHLKELTKVILNEFNGEIPKSRDELMKLPGVGRKTANLVMNRAYNVPAIAVDTHVHRISNLLGWVHTSTPIETEKVLNQVLPKHYWKDINRLFVSIGRQFPSVKRLKRFLLENDLIVK